MKLYKHNNKKKSFQSFSTDTKAFTLVELIVVLAIFALVATFLIGRTGTFQHWKEEGQIRKLYELIEFLHHQAVADQIYYQIEFDLNSNAYRVGTLQSTDQIDEDLQYLAADAGNLTLELASFLNPSFGGDQVLIPPANFPSLAAPVSFEGTVRLESIKTIRAITTAQQGGVAYLQFSPRGFSDFAVLHLSLSGDRVRTLLINPFTGIVEVFRDYRDFEWTYGRKTT